MSGITDFRRKLEGTWQCLSMTATSIGNPNDIMHPWTENVIGSLMYSSDGYMKAIICRPDLATYSPDEVNPTSKMSSQVDAGLNAYTGRYSLGEKVGNEQIIYHYVELSVPPAWVGSTQTRYCTMAEREDGRLQIVMRAAQTMPAEGGNPERRVELKFVKKPAHDPDQR